MIEENSESLLRRYMNQESLAAIQLYDRYAERVIALAQSRIFEILKSRISPEDIAQETFAAFFAKADKGEIYWKRAGDLWRLLAGITINKIRSASQYHSTAQRSVLSEVSTTDPSMSHVKNFSLADFEDSLNFILETEKPLVRKIIALRLAGFSTTEIAENLERSPRTVRRLIDSIRIRFSRELELGIESTQSTSNLKNRSLDEFILLQMLGAGSFGKVYLSREKLTQKLFAIKVLKKKWLTNLKVKQAFKNEYALMTQLDHPNIVRVLGWGDSPGTAGLFIQMELINGTLLAHAEGLSRVPCCLTIARQILEAIQYLHCNRVAHLDLRPSNFLLAQSGLVKLVDFGLARSRNGAPTLSRSASLRMLDQKSDIRSLSRLLEFIAEKFEAGAEEFRLLQHLANQCRSPSTTISELVDDLNNFQTGS